MKLYIANGMYVGTQAEAKRIDKAFTEEEVPTNKESLIDYLNKVTHIPAMVAPTFTPNDELVIGAPTGYYPNGEAVPVSVGTSATEIEEFILNQASVKQVENIFQCLGTRFKELASKQEMLS